MPTLIKNGKNYSGTSVSLTQAEYDALTETQKNDGTVYFITDSDAVLDASDVSVGSGTVEDSIGSIAVIETSPATSAHAVGTYLVYNGKLYKVTSAIAVGETLTVGTNISATNVGSEISSMCSIAYPILLSQQYNASTWLDGFQVKVKKGDVVAWSGKSSATSGAFSIKIEGSVSGTYRNSQANHAEYNVCGLISLVRAEANEVLSFTSYTNTATTFSNMTITVTRRL